MYNYFSYFAILLLFFSFLFPHLVSYSSTDEFFFYHSCDSVPTPNNIHPPPNIDESMGICIYTCCSSIANDYTTLNLLSALQCNQILQLTWPGQHWMKVWAALIMTLYWAGSRHSLQTWRWDGWRYSMRSSTAAPALTCGMRWVSCFNLVCLITTSALS